MLGMRTWGIIVAYKGRCQVYLYTHDPSLNPTRQGMSRASGVDLSLSLSILWRMVWSNLLMLSFASQGTALSSAALGALHFDVHLHGI
jgi:hypothetical protein